ncbi:MAG: imelysin family protein [Litorivicinus sp.]
MKWKFLALAALSVNALADDTAMLSHVADLGLAIYQDSLSSAQALAAANRALVASPSVETLTAARQAWVNSRTAYQQSEAFRFGNPVVDAFEGQVNAWPLDEGLIDYVAEDAAFEVSENGYALANVIANPQLTLGSEVLDFSTITADSLGQLHEAGGNEANVAQGYHAIEFLLWGQDLNGLEAGAGDRPWTDYSTTHCTNGNCARRGDYLTAASDLMVRDLEGIVAAFELGGAGRQAVMDGGVESLLTGLGSLTYGELAGQRTQLGYLLQDPEEEHDCFSDNTHFSHFYDVQGIRNLWTGGYRRLDGTLISGPGLMSWLQGQSDALAAQVQASLDEASIAASELVRVAVHEMAYDQMLGQQHPVVPRFVDALVGHAKDIEAVVAELELENVTIEGSDSLAAN